MVDGDELEPETNDGPEPAVATADTGEPLVAAETVLDDDGGPSDQPPPETADDAVPAADGPGFADASVAASEVAEPESADASVAVPEAVEFESADASVAESVVSDAAPMVAVSESADASVAVPEAVEFESADASVAESVVSDAAPMVAVSESADASDAVPEAAESEFESADAPVAGPVASDAAPEAAESGSADASVAAPVAGEFESADAPDAVPEVAEFESADASVAESAVSDAAPMVAESESADASVAVPEAAESGSADAPVTEPAAADAAPGETKAKARKPPARILEGVVTAVSSEEVELTLDDGRSAVINRRNFGPGEETPDQILSIGDRAFGAELKRDDPKKRVVLSRAWALKKQAWDRVVEAASHNTTLTGTVTSVGGKGLVVDVGVRGFVPTSHLTLEPVSDLNSFLGQRLELRVLEADPRRERLVLSRRNILLKEQRRRTQGIIASLKPGDTCQGTVSSLTNYGAFVDIGGVNGLVHLSELSWTRVKRPADVVSIGDKIEVKVLDVKAKKRRISLSIRQLTPDPLSELEVGEVRFGPVTRLVDFGAFVSLGAVEGLVHLSEMAEYRVSTPEEVVTPGDEVGVKILSIDAKRRRIELSIRRAAEYG